MKMILAAAAVAAAFASPVLGQPSSHYAVPPAQYAPNGGAPYIYPPDRHAHSANPADDVYDTRGRYIGSDPDPFIRDYLARGHSRE